MFRTQTDDFSCGPVAVINAYRYINNKFPKTTLNRLRYICKTNEYYGTERKNLIKNTIIDLSEETYNVRRIKTFKAFILLYSVSKLQAHYVFVIKNNNKYTIYNTFDNVNDNYYQITTSEKEFHFNYLKPDMYNNEKYPVAWNIK